MKLSVIVPVYNEEKVISNCINSLLKQVASSLEIILVDDGSTDSTVGEIEQAQPRNKNILLLKQNHLGPGAARNLGASKASGEIIIFVDADMEFAPDFLEKLTAPIDGKNIIGTFSKDEYLLNKNNALARCWNLNQGRSADRMIGASEYPNGCPVFRAILKSKFDEVGGFDSKIGYTDDWSLSRKSNTLATVAPGAIYYHSNPETLSEVWHQARWFGKNEFLTGSLVRKFYNLFRYFPMLSVIKGLIGVIKFKEAQFFQFKIIFDCAVFVSVLRSFLNEQKSKN